MPFPPSVLARRLAAKPQFWLCLLLFFSIIAAYAAAVASASTLLRCNLSVGGVAVGRLTRDQAIRRLARTLAPAGALPLTLNYEGGSLSAQPAMLGLRLDPAQAVDEAIKITREKRWSIIFRPIDIPISVVNDADVLQRFLTPLAAATEAAPRDAAAVVQGDTWVIEPEAAGRKIDLPALTFALKESVLAPSNRTVTVPYRRLTPRVTAGDLAARDARTLLVKFRTLFDETNLNRSSNIRVGIEALAAYWLEPGGVFSYNTITARGANSHRYKEAKVYEQGRVVSGIGGGVCQVSSTLYNAALLANLEIVERHPHSLTVPYIEPGRDATVSDGGADLQFRNTTGHYLLIAAAATGGKLTVRVFGPADYRPEIEIRTAVVREIAPPVRQMNDPGLTAGEQKTMQAGKSGCQVKTWKIIKKDGKEISRTLLSLDTYQPLEGIIRVGTKPVVPVVSTD